MEAKYTQLLLYADDQRKNHQTRPKQQVLTFLVWIHFKNQQVLDILPDSS